MKVVVDSDLCSACGLCVDTAPDVFEMGEDTAIVLVETVPPALEDDVKLAADDCPEDAIAVED